MRYEEYMKNVIEDFLANGTIEESSFPDMELYMDQAAGFMNKKLSIYKADQKDTVITKTMIGNYVKHGMLPRPENKKYSKDHLIILTLIYYLKSTFQMDEIEKLMKPIIENYNSEFDDKIDLGLLYASIANVQEEERKKMAKSSMEDVDNLKHALSHGDLSDDDMLELFALIVNLSMKADFQKHLAQKLLNEYFMKPKKQK